MTEWANWDEDPVEGQDHIYDHIWTGMRDYVKSAGFPWHEVTETSHAMIVNTGYIANNASLCTITLPSTASVGQRVAIAGYGAGMWRLSQNANQYVIFLSTTSTTGTGGYLLATTRYDSIELVCVVTDNGWLVTNAVGNISVI